MESFIDYQVPPEEISALAGSTAVPSSSGRPGRCGPLPRRAGDFLALNLMHGIVADAKWVTQVRRYYAKEFLDYRRRPPTPYMEGLRFRPSSGGTADPDTPLISDEELEEAQRQGKAA